MEDEAACRSNPRGEKPCRVCLGRDYFAGHDRSRALEILLSLAGRVPDLAFANL